MVLLESLYWQAKCYDYLEAFVGFRSGSHHSRELFYVVLNAPNVIRFDPHISSKGPTVFSCWFRAVSIAFTSTKADLLKFRQLAKGVLQICSFNIESSHEPLAMNLSTPVPVVKMQICHRASLAQYWNLLGDWGEEALAEIHFTPFLGIDRTTVLGHPTIVDDTFDESGEMRGRNKHAKPAETIHVPSEVYITKKRHFGRIIELFAGEAGIL